MPRVLALTGILFYGCLTARPSKGEVALEADTDRTGEIGADGPLAVGRVELDVQARVVDTFSFVAFYPLDADGVAAPATTPLLVIVQERGVAVERYFWLATHFASRGYPAIVVDHFADSPLVEIDNGWLALDAARKASRFNGALKNLLTDDTKAVIIGHGEGAQAAQDLWVRYKDFVSLLAIGGAVTSDYSREDGEALCVSGDNDKEWGAMQRACATFPFATFSTIEGANHFMFTDAVVSVERDRDGVLAGDLTTLRVNALRVIDAWLDATLKDDQTAKRALSDRELPGVSFAR